MVCLAEAQARFTQANNTPCMIELLYTNLHWLGIHLPAFDQIAASMYTPQDQTPTSTQALIPLLQWPPEITDQPMTLSQTAHKTGGLKAKEATASSKLGAHFGHYKTGTLHDDINKMHTLLVKIPLWSRILYWRWKKGINVMLKNERKLWCGEIHIILVFEVDFNQLNRFIGKEMMQQAEMTGLVAGEQYSSRNGKSTSNQSLNKRLAFNIIWQTRRAAIICSSNVKLCYDHIVHQIVAQCMYRCSIPKLTLICMFTTLQNLHHHVRTLYGNSEVWGSTNIWGVQVSGIGQGNGAGPQIWAVVSTPILDLLCQEKFRAAFKASISNNHIAFIGYSFVDNTDLIQTGPNIDSTCDNILPLMQATLDTWSAGLQVTSSALVPAKSFWYAINFQWSTRHWKYKKPKPDQELLMSDYKNTCLPIQLLGPTKAQQTLGVYLVPDGNKKTQTQILIKKITTWADKARTGHLNQNTAWLNLMTTLLCQINYVLPATILSPQQCKKSCDLTYKLD